MFNETDYAKYKTALQRRQKNLIEELSAEPQPSESISSSDEEDAEVIIVERQCDPEQPPLSITLRLRDAKKQLVPITIRHDSNIVALTNEYFKLTSNVNCAPSRMIVKNVDGQQFCGDSKLSLSECEIEDGDMVDIQFR